MGQVSLFLFIFGYLVILVILVIFGYRTYGQLE
jgi:hypothetical protein